MTSIRKVLSWASLAALVGLVVVAVLAVGTLLVRNPARTAIVLLLVAVAAVILGAVTKPFAPRVKKGTILELDLRKAPAEGGGASNPIAALRPSKALNLADMVETLHRAADDKRVAGLILHPRFELAPRAVIDELREAIVAFGASGKFTVAIADSFGEDGGANGAYLLATACQTITLQETGSAGLTPLTVDGNFYPDVLERLGLGLEVFGRGKYKSAPNRFTLKKFSPADREQTQVMLDAFWDQMVSTVAKARNITVDEILAMANKGPQMANAALERGLVDRIAYPDESMAEAKERVGKDAKLVYLHLYKKRIGKPRVKGKSVGVAVIRAVGEIRREATLPIGISGGSVLAPDTLVPHIRAAVKDKNVKAVVLRIDSPGGSALASDSMWRELVRVKEAGKPLVASMAGVAASGGYYIAAPADKIVALPSTVTGSIGVFGMVPNVVEAKKKLNIHTDEIHTGAEPGGSINRRVSRTFKKRIEAEIDAIYETFKGRVSDGRALPMESVEEVAQGRVWTGADAVNAGLVDELGGLDRAVALAVELTGAAPGTKGKVKTFPKKASGISALKRSKGDNSEDAAAAASISLTPDVLRVFRRAYSGVHAHLGFDPRIFWTR